MSKKLSDNGLWESSRMMLPEHKEAIVQHNRELNRKERAVLDEQGQEEISWALVTSLQEQIPMTITLFGVFEDVHIAGIVTQLDVQKQRVRLRSADEEQWIALRDITRVE